MGHLSRNSQSPYINFFFFFCCKLAHISWLQTTQRCYLTVLEARFLNKSCWAKMKMSAVFCSFLKTLGENLFSCHFQLLEAVCIPCSWPPSIFKAGNSWLWLSLISLLWSLCLPLPHLFFYFFFIFFLVFYFLNFKIFNSYMHSQTWTPLPPPSP